MSIQEFSQTPPGPVPLAPHRFTVEQYHDMIAAGILTRKDRVQLLDGVIAEMSPIGPPHSYVVQAMMHAILRPVGEAWEVRVQQPVTFATSEPEPDLVVARGTYEDYLDRHPGPADIGLLVEVADSSLATDPITKARIYAAAGVRTYWIVNLIDRCVEIRRDPVVVGSAKTAYPPCEIVPATGKLALELDGVALGEISVASIIP